MKGLAVVVTLFTVLALTYADSAFDEDGELYGLLDEVKVAEKYVHMIEHFGAKAWSFLKCMGLKWALDCVQPTLSCMLAHSIPGCVSLVVCEGKDAKICVHNLGEVPDNTTVTAAHTY